MHIPTGLRRSLRPRAIVVAVSVVALLGCSADPDDPTTEDPGTEDTGSEDPDATGDADDGDDPSDPGTEPDDGDGDQAGDGDDDTPTDEDPDSVPPIAEDGDTEPKSAEGETGGLDEEDRLRPQAVTEVRVATHDGFDRVVFELVSDGGTPGWFLEYGEPRAQGSGELVQIAGDAALTVMIRPVLLPPDLPDDVETWTGPPIDGPAGGVVQEVVGGPIFEGDHQFFIGIDVERPFAVTRLSDPARIVIDIFHTGG